MAIQEQNDAIYGCNHEEIALEAYQKTQQVLMRFTLLSTEFPFLGDYSFVFDWM